MPDFILFRDNVKASFNKMTKENRLFQVDITGDELWEHYLDSFPSGSNVLFRERTEHDCSCCKNFIRQVGGLISIDNKGNIHTIWDKVKNLSDRYRIVTKSMSTLVKSKDISHIFFTNEKSYGLLNNRELLNDSVKVWSHFQLDMPDQVFRAESGMYKARIMSNIESTMLAVDSITLDSLSIILELIAQGTLYKGDEFKSSVEQFERLLKKLSKFKGKKRELIVYREAIGAFRSSVIGTLACDLSDGLDIESAVGKYEAKVAPENYQRPTAIVTKSMIKKAKEKVMQLELQDSLARRHAVMDDITINNVLYADRDTKKILDPFDVLEEAIPDKVKNYDKIEEVSIDTFVKDILPKVDTLELLFERDLKPNLMTLVAPVNGDANSILKWDNNFTWTYNGDLADSSMRAKIEKAGGLTNAPLRCSLEWYNTDDLDIHIWEPDSHHICHCRKYHSSTTGRLDVDMNVRGETREPVENIVWSNKARILEGNYVMKVHNYTHREHIDVGFKCEIECGGELVELEYGLEVRNEQYIKVAEFSYSRKDGLKIIKSLKSQQVMTQPVWNLNPSTFNKVKMVMSSPNHWDDNAIGNKHIFFIVEGCQNPNAVRGFYNEYLRPDLKEHRKVFEILANTMKAEFQEDQLSGLGFSFTQKKEFVVRITGASKRLLKVRM